MKMPKLWIDNQAVEVEPGSTVLEAARKLGINIPALCYLDGVGRPTSCLVCLVRVNGADQLVPSCATRAEEGMQVASETEEVREARRTALELLLSDHVGDCLAPCHRACPLGMNIPVMIRHVLAERMQEAAAVVKSEIPFPAILGRVCHAPCERGCRRVLHDEAVSIALLERFIGDTDLSSGTRCVPAREQTTGKRVAIVGAGPAGLVAAYFLLRDGHECTLFDDGERPGGTLRYEVPEDALPKAVLDAEVEVLTTLGAQFRTGTRIGGGLSLEQLREDYDAVLVATGVLQEGNTFGLEVAGQGVKVDLRTHETALRGVFAAGEVVRGSEAIVRSMAEGKAAAFCIHQFLSSAPVTGPTRSFTSVMGRLLDGEIGKFLVGASPAPRLIPSSGAESGFAPQEACEEGRRCLHCDCRKADDCALRTWSDEYHADQRRYRSTRRAFEQNSEHPCVVYEPGKCIACGRCVMIAEAAREALGLTFIGRGFNVRVGVPFNRSLAEGLQKVAAACVLHCPTAALAFKDDCDSE